MQHFENATLKALFSQVVEAIGTQDAAAAYLGVSRQRVGALVSAKPEHQGDVPTWAQVWTLEKAYGHSLVFAALARMVQGEAPANVLATAIAANSACSRSLQVTADMAADGEIEADELKVAREASRIALAQQQAHHDALMAARPKLKAVS